MLPTFLVIGSQKAGTTSVYHTLKRASEIYMPSKKEVNFFFLEREYAQGIRHYENYFEHVPQEAIHLGEASPGYICHPEAPQRIFRHLPDVRMILTVRNPVERAYSQYWEHRRKLVEPLTFDERIRDNLHQEYFPGTVGYFSRGLYMKYIQRYISLFNQERLLVIPFEDLRSDPLNFYSRIYEFLGIGDQKKANPIHEQRNQSKIYLNPMYLFFFAHPKLHSFNIRRFKRIVFWGKRVEFKYPPMSECARNTLEEYYRPWNERLSAYMGRDMYL